MIRSLLAVIVAVLAGFATSRFVEGAGAAALGESAAPGIALSPPYQGVLFAGWFAGALVAALVALLIGRRWTPLGALAAGVMLFSAVIALVSSPAHWLLWPGALIATAGGGFAAVKLTGATMRSGNAQPRTGLFDE